MNATTTRALVPIPLFALALAGLVGCTADTDTVAGFDAEELVLPDNPNCASIGVSGLFETKFDSPTSGTFDLDPENQVTISTDGTYFDWSATTGIDYVIVKGGTDGNVYEYDPEATQDTGLHSPINPNTDQPYGISHISFCFDYEVQATKTARTSLSRTFTWGIDKTGATSELVFSPGQAIDVGYEVTVSVTGSEDSDWAVEGEIEILNPAPVAALITGVQDSLEGENIPVDCDEDLPFELAPGETLVCHYATDLPDGAERVNTAIITTEGVVGGDEAEADVSFLDAEVHGVDACVDVDDDLYGPLGTVCAEESPKVFAYLMEVGPYADCGPRTHVNVASFLAEDSGATGSDDHAIDVDVPCATGCTLTPGYWKTHSEYGPARYDDTWALLAGGADTPFFLNDASYYEVLHTAPKGNPYYILAHATIAAELNHLNGADFTAAANAFDKAVQIFEVFSPADIDALHRRDPLRADMIDLATTLDDYNNGLIGPGHCSE